MSFIPDPYVDGDDAPHPGTLVAADMDAHEADPDAHIGTYVELDVIDAAGDLIVGTGPDGVGRLAKGSALDVLRVNAGATALEWAAPSGGGGVTSPGSVDNYAVGTDALLVAQATALNNIGVGTNALKALTTGDNNLAFGSGALAAATTGDNNVAIGHRALVVGGIAIGTDALGAATSGASIAIGREALLSMTGSSSYGHVGLGTNVMKNLTGGEFSIAIGNDSMSGNAGQTTQNIGIGAYTLNTITTGGIDNIAIGYQAAMSLQTGGRNIVIGTRAGDALTTATDNVAIGSDALGANQTRAGLVAIGPLAMAATLNPPASSTAVGYWALKAQTTGFHNTALGASALVALTTGNRNIAIGNSALAAITTQSGNVAIGESSNPAATTGNSNVSVGTWTLLSNQTGAENTAIGHSAMQNSTTAVNNVAVGSAALYGLTTGNHNVALGYAALAYPAGVGANSTTTGIRNVGIGPSCGQNSATQRSHTVAVGSNALVDGDYAVAIGSGAKALHANAVALGDAVQTTNTAQVNTGAKRLVAGAPATAPADADLINGQLSFWINEASNLLAFKVKWSDGTVKNGTVALT